MSVSLNYVATRNATKASIPKTLSDCKQENMFAQPAVEIVHPKKVHFGYEDNYTEMHKQVEHKFPALERIWHAE